MNRKRVLFYSSVVSRKMFSIQGFYRTDIQILRDLGYSVHLSKTFLDYLLFWRYDVAFIYFYRYGLLPALLARLFGKKVYFTGGVDFLDKDYAGAKRYFIQKMFFKACNLLSHKSIIVSTCDLSHVEHIYNGQLPSNIVMSSHVVDVEKFKHYTEPPKEKIISTIAWMVHVENIYRKGVDKMIRVFAECAHLIPDYQLLVIGPKGDGSIYLQQLIDQLGLTYRVTLVGTVTEEEKIDYLKRSSYYFQLSEYEGFGISSIEALLAGNVLIHSGRGGLIDALGDNGIKVDDINNYKQIASLLCNHIQNTDVSQRALQKQKGIDYVESRFAYPKRMAEIREVMAR